MEYSIASVALGFGILIFLYALLTLEIVHRTVAALFTASIVVVLNIVLRFVGFTDLINEIDMNTILLLMCMMMFVSILSKTGIFSHASSALLRRLHAKPFTLIAVLSAVTATVSAFIDNVTTVLLISPVILEISRRLKIDPRPILLSIVFASNIGGTATLIGDPPNILIGSKAGLGFKDFIYNLTPAVMMSFLAFLAVMALLLRGWLRRYSPSSEGVGGWVTHVDRTLLYKALVSLSITLALFGLEDVFEYPPAIPPIVGIGILLMLARGRVGVQDVLSDVDWSTLVFFMAMFIVIRGVEALGVMDFIAGGIMSVAQGYAALLIIIVWISAVVSAFVDNIPFVMSMIPVIARIAATASVASTPLYWALSLGGCLGGNGTLVGASANVVVAGIAERHGHPISFRSFLKYGMPVMTVTVAVSTAYLIIRYCVLHI